MTTYTFSPIDDPMATNGHRASGINDLGQIVGDYVDSSGVQHGFLYSGGTYTTLNAPSGTNGTDAYGINDLGQIVGYYKDSSSTEHGFLYTAAAPTPRSTIRWAPMAPRAMASTTRARSSGTTLTATAMRTASSTAAAPTPRSTIRSGTKGTQAYGINDAGQIVGNYIDSSGTSTASSTAAAPTPRSTIRWATNGTFALWHQRRGPDRRVLRGQQRHRSTASSTAAAPTLLLTMPWAPWHLCVSASTTRARSSGTTMTAAARCTASLLRLRRRPLIRLLP